MIGRWPSGQPLMRSPADPNQLDSELASITLLSRTVSPTLCLRPEKSLLAHWGIPWFRMGGAARYGRRFARSKRREGEALIREADNLACQSWNEKMWSDGDPIEPIADDS